MSRPHTALVLLALGLGGCSFRSGFEVEVQVYGGETLPTFSLFDPQTVLQASLDIESSCREAADVVHQAGAQIEASFAALQQLGQAEAALLEDLQQSEEYTEAVNTYLATWDDFLREGVLTQGFVVDGQVRLSVDGVPLEDLVSDALRDGLLDDDADDAAELFDCLRSQVGLAQPNNEHELHSVAELQSLHEPFTAAAQRFLDRGRRLPSYANTASLGEMIRVQEERIRAATANVDAALQMVLAARRKVTDALESDGSFSQALDTFQEFNGAVQQFTVVYASLLESGLSDNIADWAELIAEPQDSLSRRASAIWSESSDAGALAARSEEIVTVLAENEERATALGELSLQAEEQPERLQQDRRNQVAKIREAPYVVDDPNIGTILDEANAQLWRKVPVDQLKSSGEGTAQYVVVQDGPTSYRLKELQIDPQGVVSLQVSMGEIGLGLLSEVASLAAASAGVRTSSDNDGGEPSPMSGGGGSALPSQMQLLKDEYQRMISTLLAELRPTLESAGSVSLAKLQSTLAGTLESYQRNMEDLAAEARRLIEREGNPDND